MQRTWDGLPSPHGQPFLHNISGAVIANSPTIVIHTERSISTVPPCNSHRKPVLRLLKWHDGTRHVDGVVFPRCSPLSI